MILYACFTVFDGLEMLEPSIARISPYVDGIIICYQKVSNKGNVSNDIISKLDKFGFNSKVSFVNYETDLKLGPKENERRKHQLMIDTARYKNATHFIMMATDHFYTDKQFYEWKLKIANSDYDCTFTQMYTYYKKPTWQLTPPETYYMPFICKLYPQTSIQRIKNYPVFTDPSVQVNTCSKFLCLGLDEIALHHYSLVRNGFDSMVEKFVNAASPWTNDQITDFLSEYSDYDIEENPGVKYFQGRKIKVVDDYFKLEPIFES
jgi:hypothetical protein